MPLMLNNLLELNGVDPANTLVLRHVPGETKLRRVFPWIAAEKPEVFNAYQKGHGEKLEKTMAKLARQGTIAAFIGHDPGKALLVGLYDIVGHDTIDYEGFVATPEIQTLFKLGMNDPGPDGFREGTQWFDLDLRTHLLEWRGRLVIKWPGSERSWYRWAHNNEIEIEAISEDSKLVGPLPNWRDMIFNWQELSSLPKTWRSQLSEWRGVYYIHDTSDNRGYVGAAYGAENILGRWVQYSKTGHGDNKHLIKRDPENFVFSILERVSPDTDVSSVTRLESQWKRRLHTLYPAGLNDK